MRVYMPDFFHGEVVPPNLMDDPELRAKFDFMEFMKRHPKDVELAEVSAFIEDLRKNHHVKKIATIGFWYVFYFPAVTEGIILFNCRAVGEDGPVLSWELPTSLMQSL
jgi:hypothetical protein